MSAAERDRLPVLADLLAGVRRHVLLGVVLILLGAAVGAGLHLLVPTRYHATSSVALAPRLVHVPLDVENSEEREVTLDTAAALVRSDRVVTEICRTTGLSDEEVRARLTLSARPASRVLVIGFRADTRDQAEAASHTAVEALLSLQDRVLALSRTQLRLLRNQVNLVTAQAQERTQEGLDATSLFDSVVQLQDRLDRTVESTRTPSTVVRRTEVLAYRTSRLEVAVGTGAAAGLGAALLLLRLARLARALDLPRRPRARPRVHPARPRLTPAPAPVVPLAAVVRHSLRERSDP